MSIDISAKLMVGLQYSDLIEDMSDHDIAMLNLDLDYCEVEYACPSYDCPRKYWTVGYEITCTDPDKIGSAINALTKQFKLKYNKIPKRNNMETKTFPAVIAAKKYAEEQMKYYYEMMRLAKEQRTTL